MQGQGDHSCGKTTRGEHHRGSQSVFGKPALSSSGCAEQAATPTEESFATGKRKRAKPEITGRKRFQRCGRAGPGQAGTPAPPFFEGRSARSHVDGKHRCGRVVESQLSARQARAHAQPDEADHSRDALILGSVCKGLRTYFLLWPCRSAGLSSCQAQCFSVGAPAFMRGGRRSASARSGKKLPPQWITLFALGPLDWRFALRAPQDISLGLKGPLAIFEPRFSLELSPGSPC